MKLLAHNLLISNKKGVKNGYPLIIEVEEITIQVSPFNPAFIQNMISKLDWNVFRVAALQLYKSLQATNSSASSSSASSDVKIQPPNLPEEINESLVHDEAFLRTVHHYLLEVVLVKGNLVCPESGRKYPVVNGIPNMILNEDEV